MPTYEYLCQTCQNRFEKFQRMTDEPEKSCPECGGSVRRVIFPAGVIFKGSGFYATDSRKSEGAAASTTGESGEATTPTADKADKAETKPAATTETSKSKEPAVSAA
jgi:putative FmdB family regulatory protein